MLTALIIVGKCVMIDSDPNAFSFFSYLYSQYLQFESVPEVPAFILFVSGFVVMVSLGWIKRNRE
ncbi:MAG: hypothetical protein GXY77_04350 [Fibrobacter sp.]|nr:hypothetical protein [Fibrobacter sp.]